MTRYRLRFLLQEIDLPRGETLLGRSPECQVTLEDPLVSRQHARIVIDDNGATCEDLGSRNGVKVNGLAARKATKLKNGDRLRIGTQEFVFYEIVNASPASARTTGFLRHCGACRIPYPREMVACPNCGTSDLAVDDDDTMTGALEGEPRQLWNVQLLIEVAQKAFTLGQHQDVTRALGRANTHLEECVAAHDPLDPAQVDLLVALCVRATLECADVTSLEAVMRICAGAKIAPSQMTLDLFLNGLPETVERPLVAPLRDLINALNAADAPSQAQPGTLLRLNSLLHTFGRHDADAESHGNPTANS